MRTIRKVHEAEVIGEFLRNEFYMKEFDHDRHQFEQLVMDPDYSDAAENAVRRALLFRRRGHLWRELPLDTRWFEVELENQDLARLQVYRSVFLRAEWRRLSNGTFSITEAVKSARDGGHAGNAVFEKIQELRGRLETSNEAHGTVLLIGVDKGKPFTVLEGNHRLTAALLASPDVMPSFRVLCGFSPSMAETCWYRRDVPNVLRYLKNRILHLYDREADVERLTVVLPAATAKVPKKLAKVAVRESVSVTEPQN